MKIYKCIALVTLILGLALCVGGVLMNGLDQLPGEAQKVTNNVKFKSFGKEKDVNLELGVDAHCNLDLELSALNGKIVYYDGNTIKVEGSHVNKDYDFKYNGQVADISFTGVTRKKETSNLTLYIPRNIQFNHIDLDIDASKITIEDLQCNQLEMESDTSKVTIKHLLVKGNTDISNDMGDLEISNLDTYNLDLENDMGNVSLVMTDTRDQYKVTKDGSMSSIHISDASQVIGNKNIDIDTDMGNVTIHFKGE